MNEPERKSRKWWYVGDTDVHHETGWDCGGEGGAWWFPTMGYTVFEGGGTIFEDKGEAVRKLGGNLADELAEAEKAMKAFKKKYL